MTVASTIDRVRLEGNGSTTAFPAGIKIFSKNDIVVKTLNRTTSEVVNTLVLDDAGTLGFSVTFDTDQETLTVTANTAPTATEDLFIQRILAQTQDEDLPLITKFPSLAVENALDRLVLIVQDQQGSLDRTLTFPAQLTITSELPIPVNDKIMAWSGTDGTLVNSTKTLTDIEGAVDGVAALTAQSGVKVSSDDTATGFLDGKLIAGDGLSFTVNNPGSAETMNVNPDVELVAASRLYLNANYF